MRVSKVDIPLFSRFLGVALALLWSEPLRAERYVSVVSSGRVNLRPESGGSPLKSISSDVGQLKFIRTVGAGRNTFHIVEVTPEQVGPGVCRAGQASCRVRIWADSGATTVVNSPMTKVAKQPSVVSASAHSMPRDAIKDSGEDSTVSTVDVDVSSGPQAGNRLASSISSQIDHLDFVTEANLNIRFKPTARSKKLTNLALGTVVKAESVEGTHWMKIHFPDGRTGYASGKFLRQMAHQNSASASRVVAASGEKTRSEPSTTGRVIVSTKNSPGRGDESRPEQMPERGEQTSDEQTSMEAFAGCEDCKQQEGFPAVEALRPLAEELSRKSTPCGHLDDELRARNCEAILQMAEEGKIPKNALLYALSFLRDNTGQLADPSCLTHPDDRPWRKTLEQGVKNTCSFAINDIDHEVPGYSDRTHGYFVDLCAQDSAPVLSTLYFNRGIGNRRKKTRYIDVDKKRSTVPGAFLTGDTITDFTPYKWTKSYRALRKKGVLKRLGLYGVNSSNNETAAGKPMHVSPLISSWGCPSIGEESLPMMQKLAEEGPSLLLNWGPERFHQSTTRCHND